MVNNINDLYKKLNDSIELLRSELKSSYLDALIEVGDDLCDHGVVRVENGIPSVKVQKKLQENYNFILSSINEPQKFREIFQFILINALHNDKFDSNHQLTPDTIAYIMGYMINCLNDKTNLSIVDISVGTGNLLATILNQLKENHNLLNIRSFGIDNDESMIAVSNINFTLQNLNTVLIHQDSLSNLSFKDSIDFVIGDLPVGYYPLNVQNRGYKTSFDDGLSYSHYLLIEQGMNILSSSGWGLFLVPSNIFNDKKSEQLLKWINDNVYLQGIINLPSDIFKNSKSQKSLLLLQKKGKTARQANPVLLGDIASFKNGDSFKRNINQITNWINELKEN